MDATNSRPERLPASPAQAQLWLAEALDQGHGTLNDRFAVRLRGHLDTAALRIAVTGLVERHEPLRTRFHVRDDAIVQEIDPAAVVDYAEQDVIGLDDAEVRALAAGLSWQPFDLAVDSPLRVRLLRLGPDDHLLVVVLHHIASDLESPWIALKDLEQLYIAETTGTPVDLPPLAIRYADIARSQHERIAAGEFDRLVDRWAERLRGVTPSAGLAAAWDGTGERGSSLDHTLSAELGMTVRELARTHHLSVFTFLQTVFRLFLWRVTDQPDVIVASPVTQRTDTALDGVIGPFLNVVALRNAIRPTETFLRTAALERQAVLTGMVNGTLPYGTVAELLSRHTQPESLPPLDILFEFEEEPALRTIFADLAVTHVDLGEIAQRYQLVVKVVGTSDGPLRTRWSYASCFDRATVAELVSGFEEILAAVVADPSVAVDSLPRLRRTRAQRPAAGTPEQAERAPEGTTECYVADIWAELLNVDAVDNAEATIFALGGASMTVARLAARLTEEFGVRVTAVDLFEHRTVAAQAALLDDRLFADLAGHDIGDLDTALAALDS